MKLSRISHRIKFAFLCMTLMLFTIGCGGGAPNDRPDLGTVSGKVTLDGKPAPNVIVTFYPDEGRPSSGKTDDSGMYTLQYTADSPGAKVGNHKVQISVPETTTGEEGGEGGEAEPAEAMPPDWVKIPAKYNTETELTAQVEAGENTKDFELTSQ